MGLSFKENCADLRNSGVKKVIEKLKNQKCNLDLYDPWVDTVEAKKIYGISVKQKLKKNTYDGIIIAVKHKKFIDMGKKKIFNLCKTNHVIYDLKYILYKDKVSLRL